ncbi:MAG: RelA/SpoT family protein [Alphaproteobacteria bacterium]
MIRQYELIEKIKSYDASADEDAINRAYVFAMKVHGSQKRESGDPYFSHPLEVAGILTDLKLDTATIITALLHDTVEDTSATLEEIRNLFGDEVADLVDGVTKLNQLDLISSKTKQAENLRKLLMAMSKDIRVLLVKLADRLHNMQTLRYVDRPEKRRRIARETLEIYAPLAERIALRRIKNKLEDLAFEQLYGEARRSIVQRLEFLRTQDENVIEKIAEDLTSALEKEGVKAEVTGREKTPFSIWKKMETKKIGFEQLADIMAFRVIVDNVGQCYEALGVIHSQFTVVPGRFKDYISIPKRNGYQSIHTIIIGPHKKRIEVQIRTREMHEISEYGVAAHWSYKQGSPNQATDGVQYRWMRELLEIIENDDDMDEFLEHTKLNMFHDQVFCFTPSGDLIALPKGASVVDFAYAIHSEIGDTCVGSKINGRIAPLRTKLSNGDQIEIMTDKKATPSVGWEQFVVTGHAKSRIRRFLRAQKQSEYMALGKESLQQFFRKRHQKLVEKDLEPIFSRLNYRSIDDLYADIGKGEISRNDIFKRRFPEAAKSADEDNTKTIDELTKRKEGQPKTKENTHISIKGLIPGMAVHFARCCHPLPGDKITGIIVTGKGVTIHTADCPTLDAFTSMPERWIDVSWDKENAQQQDKLYIARIRAIIENVVGSMGTTTTIIGVQEGDIQNIRITNRSQSSFEVTIDIKVKNSDHLDLIINALESSKKVSSVERVRY